MFKAGTQDPDAAAASASGDEIPRLRRERDRFVAFAFCASDILIELDENHVVVFAAGAVTALLGVQPEALAGQPILNLVTTQARPAISELLIAIGDGRRLEPMMARLNSSRGPTPPLLAVGYRLPDFANRIFLAFRMARTLGSEEAGGDGQSRPEGGLHDARTFTEVATQHLSASASAANPEAPIDEKLTLIELGETDELNSRLDSTAQSELKHTIASCLRANSVDGQSAAEIEEGRYGIVHSSDVDVGALEARIEECARAADPEGQGVTVRSATLDLDCDGVSEADAAQALAYTIHEFQRSPGDGLTMENLSSGLAEMLESTANRMAQVRDVIASDSFEIHFQPVVQLKSRRTTHFEALARFKSDDITMSPFEFIRFAEEVNLISELDMAVCNKAVETLRERVGMKELWPIAVNISGRSFEDPNFQDELIRLLNAHPEIRQYLLFELTESMALNDVDSTNDFMQALRAQGNKVCLDDFGVGAAAFEYLRSIDIDFVKIDGSYVQNALENEKSTHFLKAISGLCKDLGISTVAEMIEEEHYVEFLIAAGIDHGQGYLFGRPDPELKPTIPATVGGVRRAG